MTSIVIPSRDSASSRRRRLSLKSLERLGFSVRLGAEAMDTTAIYHLEEDRRDSSYSRATEAGVGTDLLLKMEGGQTAVVADLEMGDGPMLAYRIDMDALPILESAEPTHRPASAGFASEWPGQMHACGHDGHMAIGLGVAAVIAAMQCELRGRVRLIFQPAEEGAPGGAAAIAAKGLVDDVDSLICFHLGLGARTGQIVSRASFLATSKYRVRLAGEAAHVTNRPESGRNALLAAAATTLALHSIPAHGGGWFSLNVGVLHAGEEQGVTPRSASMDLGFWAENSQIHDYVNERVFEIVKGTAAAWQVESEISLIGQAPTADEDGELAGIVREVSRSIPGVEQVDDEIECRAGEDACHLLRRVTETGGRGIYMLIGSDLADGHHSPRFDFDETSLVLGTAVLSGTAKTLLDGSV